MSHKTRQEKWFFSKSWGESEFNFDGYAIKIKLSPFIEIIQKNVF
jgi:hypothetical protein